MTQAALEREIERLEEEKDTQKKAIESLQNTITGLRDAAKQHAHTQRYLARSEAAWQRQKELTAGWHAKFEQVRQENNTLRRKLFRRCTDAGVGERGRGG